MGTWNVLNYGNNEGKGPEDVLWPAPGKLTPIHRPSLGKFQFFQFGIIFKSEFSIIFDSYISQ